MLKGLQARSHVLCAFFGPVQTASSPRADVVVLVVCEQAAGNRVHSTCINNTNLIDALQVDFFLTSVELLEL
jgi:hypothetical protein